jgi:thioredoxin reductase (NADPH)
MSEYDIVIVGGGMAGMSAALFSARLGRSTFVLTGSTFGGQMMSIEGIEDFPGFPDGVAGYDLCPNLQGQATDAGAKLAMDEAVRLETGGDEWIVATSRDELRARAVIFAAGSSFARLGVPGEDALTGSGLSHCASCDGPLFRDALVGVVGGGDSALQEALALTRYGCRVIVFHRESEPIAQEAYRARVAAHEQIELRPHTEVAEVLGDGRLSGVRVRQLAGGGTTDVELGGLFPCVGLAPRTELLTDLLDLDDDGRVATDASMRTALPGLLAAGDLRTDSARQAITAAGDGATAAFTADAWLTTGVWGAAVAAAADRA